MDPKRSGTQMKPVISRRRAFQGLGGGLAATLLGNSSIPSLAAPQQSETHEVLFGQSEPQAREFVLTAEELDWEIMPGVNVRAWGYNGQTPGPELRVREGDLVRITLRNNLPVPTTIHWHGVHLPPSMDGPAGLNQAAVLPGEEFLYEFIATPGGTRWYHSHADPALQVPMGLYGPLIIEPRVASRPYTYDREYTMVLGEWDMELTPEVAAGTAERGPRDKLLRGGELGTDMFLINGRAHGAIPPVILKEGERVLLRMVNAGHLAHPIHMHGHSFKIVATDGNPVPAGMEWTKDTVLIGPSERYDLEFTGNNPGVWMFHCHIEHHMANGMMTVIQYEGHKPTGPASEIFDETVEDAAPSGHDEHDSTHELAETTVVPTESSSSQAGIPEGSAIVSMLDDRFEPAALEIPTGTVVTWINKGANWHSIAAYDGSFVSAKLSPGAFFSVPFDVPGLYQYICKHHGLQGMIGRVTVS